MLKRTKENEKDNYKYIAIFLILIIPFVALLSYYTFVNISEFMSEYIYTIIGFFWSPFILLLSDTKFEYDYSTILQLIFWTVPPLFYAYSIHDEKDDFKDNVLIGYSLMVLGLAITAIAAVIMHYIG